MINQGLSYYYLIKKAMSEYNKRFWQENWDEGLTDLDPNEWVSLKSLLNALKPSFENFSNSIALSLMGVKISYKELDEYSNQFAHMLLKFGFGKGDIVAIDLPNIPEYIIALLGAHKAGCQVSGISPLLSPKQLEYRLKKLTEKENTKLAIITLDVIISNNIVRFYKDIPNLALVITTSVSGFLPLLKKLFGTILGRFPTPKPKAAFSSALSTVLPGKFYTPLLPGKKMIDFHKQVIKDFNTTPVDVEISGDDLAFIQFTGGTSGEPKAVMLTNSNVVSDILIVQKWFGWDKDQNQEGNGIALSGFPFFHMAGIFFSLNCLYMGWNQILIPNPRDTDHICKEIEKQHPNIVLNIPSLYDLLLKNPLFSTLDHSDIEICFSSAAPFPLKSQKQLELVVGKNKLLELYGLTETSPVPIMNPLSGKRKLGTIGLPILNTELKLVDPVKKTLVKLGEVGEICIRGPQVMKGYYNDPEGTKEAFDRYGYLYTGDMAVMDEDGYLRLVGLTKDLIIVSGYKVFSKNVELTLRHHQAITKVALIGIPDPDKTGSELLKAYIQPDPIYDEEDYKSLQEDILKFAKANLASKEVPQIIEFMEKLPITANGKIDKKALKKG